jgi:hypothetical protein
MEPAQLLDIAFATLFAAVAWIINFLFNELKRVTILTNQTREQYATKMELRDDMNRVMDALHRVEDKLDKVLSRE